MRVFCQGIKQKLTGSFVQLIEIVVDIMFVVVVVVVFCARTTPAVDVSTSYPLPKAGIVALHQGLQIDVW